MRVNMKIILEQGMTASPNLKRINVVDDKAQIFQMIVKYAFNIIQI